MASFVGGEEGKHDIGLLRTDGSTKVGLILAKRNGVPRYRRYDDDPLAEQRATGEPGYGWFPPGKEFPIILDDFSGGLSQEVYDPANPSKYFKAIKMDCRFGDAIAGMKPTAMTRPTTTSVSITDGDLEDWASASDLTSWTEDVSGGAVAQETTNIVKGTYSAELRATSNGHYARIYQDLAWDNEYQGRVFTVKAWLKAGTYHTISIIIDDGVGTTEVAQASATTGYKTATRRLDAAATRLRIKIDVTQDSVDSAGNQYVDDITIVIPDIKFPKAFEDYNGNTFCGEGNVLSELDENGDAFNYVYNFPNDITGLKSFVDGNLYIALGKGNKYWYMEETAVHACDVVWDELVDTDVTAAVDINDRREGTASLKLTVAAGAAANDILVTDAISSTDYTGYTHAVLKIKSSVACSAGDLQLLLDNTAKCASPLKSLNIPALEADTWRYVSMSLGDASGLGAVISIGIKMVTDKGAFTLRIDDVRMRKFTKSTESDGDCDYFEQNLSTMYKVNRPRELKSATDPTNGGGWTSESNIDTTSYNINGVVSQDNSLYIMKEDRPYYLTAGGAVEALVDDTRAISTSDSGKNSITWHGDLFMPWGTGSLLWYHDGIPEWIDPALYCRNLGEFDGQIQGLAGDDQWLYAIVDNDTKVEVLAGREEARGWIWHGSLAEITLEGCEVAHVSSIYQKRLYIASTLSSDSLYRIPLYANYGDVTNDANRSYDTTASPELHTPKLHGGFKGDPKAFIKVVAELGHAHDTDIYYECHYQIQGDTTWTDAGDFKGTATNRKATLYVPADSGGTKPSSDWIKFKLVPKTDSATTTAQLKSLDIRAILYVTKRRIIDCVVRGCDAPLNRQKMSDAISASHIKTVLIEADNATWPVTFYPWGWEGSGDTIYVNFLSADEVIEIDEESRKPESHWYLRLLEVALS